MSYSIYKSLEIGKSSSDWSCNALLICDGSRAAMSVERVSSMSLSSLRDELTSLVSRPPARFREALREYFLEELLGSLEDSGYKVMIMDAFALKILNAMCTTSDVVSKSVAEVLGLERRREPQSSFEAIYFMQPLQESVKEMVDDMVDNPSKYKKAHVFFTSPAPVELVKRIKRNPILKNRLAGMKEVNLEYIMVDGQAFITGQDSVIKHLFGKSRPEYSWASQECIETAALRLATIFATHKELPKIRYYGGRKEESPGVPYQDKSPERLASTLSEHLQGYQDTLQDFPTSPTCDLLILDRSVDPVAALIHDWSYGGMMYDLLPMEGNKCSFEVKEDGKSNAHTAILDNNDFLWLDLQDRFFQEAVSRVTVLVDQLNTTKERHPESMKEMGELVRAVPKFVEVKAKVDIHVMTANLLMKRTISEEYIKIGQMEQGFVFGNSHSHDLEVLFQELKDISTENKLRLLGVYGATHPDKFDIERWTKESGLQESDMQTLLQLQLLGVNLSHKQWIERLQKKPWGTKQLSNKMERVGLRTFNHKPTKDEHPLTQFYPYLEDLVEDLAGGTLPEDSFPTAPSLKRNSGERDESSSATWTKSTEGGTSVRSRKTSRTDVKGKRIFVFIIGGMMRSEVRAAHRLTKQLGREVIVGSTSLMTSSQFLEELSDLSKTC